jgi:hypothetical protein
MRSLFSRDMKSVNATAISPVIHARVLRALEAIPSTGLDDDRFIQSLDREFRVFGIQVTKRHLEGVVRRWKITRRECVKTFAPILINFSRRVVSVQWRTERGNTFG